MPAGLDRERRRPGRHRTATGSNGPFDLRLMRLQRFEHRIVLLRRYSAQCTIACRAARPPAPRAATARAARSSASRFSAPVIRRWSDIAAVQHRQVSVIRGSSRRRAHRHQHRRVGGQRLVQPVGTGKHRGACACRRPCRAAATVIGSIGVDRRGQVVQRLLGRRPRRARAGGTSPPPAVPVSSRRRSSRVFERSEVSGTQRSSVSSTSIRSQSSRRPTARRRSAPAWCRPAPPKVDPVLVAAAPARSSAGDLVGGLDHQEFAVGIFDQVHGRISRQRRPSRCISISASSGPVEPGS